MEFSANFRIPVAVHEKEKPLEAQRGCVAPMVSLDDLKT
jgi:hypothetical protein